MAVLFLKSHLVGSLSYFSLTLLGSQGYWPSSSVSSYTEENLVFEMLKDNTTQSAGIQIHSATPTRRGEISANEPGTSGKCMYVCACLCVICHSIWTPFHTQFIQLISAYSHTFLAPSMQVSLRDYTVSLSDANRHMFCTHIHTHARTYTRTHLHMQAHTHRQDWDPVQEYVCSSILSLRSQNTAVICLFWDTHVCIYTNNNTWETRR